MLDVLTALSDCRHETVEKIMERRISGVSYMCWIDFHNGIWGCGFLCARLITLYFVSILSLFCLYFVSLFPATTPRAITSLPYHHGLSRLCIHPGYHTRAITLHHTRTSGYHTRHSSSYFVVLSFAGFYATCTSPPTPPPGATRYNLLHTVHLPDVLLCRAFECSSRIISIYCRGGKKTTKRDIK